MTEVREVSQ